MAIKKRTSNNPLILYPEKFNEQYDAKAQRDVKFIIDWLNTDEPGSRVQRSQIKLGKITNISQTTINQILKGQYPSPVSKHLKIVLDCIDLFNERAEDHIDNIQIVKTTVFQFVTKVCRRAHKYKDFGIVSAYVGTGKTTALKCYAKHASNVYIIEGDPDMNASVMIGELVEMTKATVHKNWNSTYGTKEERYAGVVRALKGTDALIILDEADKVREQTLEYLRRISDKCGVGIVLAGTERLGELVRDPKGRFGQISSRVGFWPALIQGITLADTRLMLASAFADDDVELNNEVIDAFWQICMGSARVLSKLIPNVRDFGLKKGHKLTPDLVFSTGQQAMGITPDGKKGGRR